MRLMRPEKAWRPIVTVEVDNQCTYETILGIDGQNPNLKELFQLYVLMNFLLMVQFVFTILVRYF